MPDARRRALAAVIVRTPGGMSDDSIVYTINLIIGAIVAGVMSRQRQLESSGRSLPAWIAAAWTLTAADLLFVLRAEWAALVPRMLPTLMVTAGHVLLLMAARRTAGQSPARSLALAVLGLHAVVLTGFVFMPDMAAWRTVANGLVWASLTFATARALQQAEPHVRTAMAQSALVLGAHGAFHVVRTLLAARAAVQPTGELVPLVQLLGDLEVGLFMVALFVSVLVAFLQLSNQELRVARNDVRELSSMLPLCAWCNKVRDDDGYWQRIEEYLAEHRINVTHGMCESCAAEHLEPEREGRTLA